jgi:hypothetical protein
LVVIGGSRGGRVEGGGVGEVLTGLQVTVRRQCNFLKR